MKRIAFTFFCIFCFSLITSAQVVETWSKQSNKYGTNFIVDSAGNSYVFTMGSTTSAFLKKVDAGGTILWARTFSDTLFPFFYTTKAQFDKQGNIVLSFSDNIHLHFSLVKYDTNGNLLWKKLTIINNVFSEIADFAVDSKNNIQVIYIVTFNLIYLQKIDANGNTISNQLVNLPSQSPYWQVQLKISNQDFTYIYFHHPFSNPMLSYLAGVDSTGVVNFLNLMPGNSVINYNSYQIEVDKLGNCIAATKHYDSLLMSISKYDSNGNILWSNMNGLSYISEINVDANNDIYISGSKNSDSICVKKLSNTGSVLWEFAYKNTLSNSNNIRNLRFANDGSIFIGSIANDVLSTTNVTSLLTLLQLQNNGTLMNEHVKAIPYSMYMTMEMNIDSKNNAYCYAFWDDTTSSNPALVPSKSMLYKLCVGRCLPNISGSLYLDRDSNCLFTTSDTGFHNQLVKIEPNDIYATTDSLGMYKFLLDTGNYTIKPVFQNKYMIHSCAKDSQLLAINATTPLAFADFGAYYYPNILDLQVSYAAAQPRPGFNQHHTISYANVGTMPVNNALVQFELDLSVFSYVSMNPPADSISGNKVFWKLAPLNVFQHGSIHFTTTVDSTIPINTPFVNIASIFPYLPDTVKYDNFDTLRERVFGAYDPNQKLVSTTQHSSINPLSPEENELAYQIDFQNTGNDTAYTVVLIDSLSDLLDVSTLRIGAGSHNFSWDISGKALLKFTFNNILLPDSHSNVSKSHGFVKFYIRPKSNLPASAIIANTATINFDFNSGVRTNTAYYPSSPIGIYETKFWSNTGTIKLFPNPTTGEFSLSYYLTTNTNVKLYLTYLLGEKINLYSNNDEKAGEHLLKFNLNNLNLKAGLYFVHLEENGNSRVGKLILGR
ncbi:MAG: T9SS type A sorting domain-containing protein [Bacteroidetes bacterium]|nr:T9SS type A sorting domain-containing protein [Bacteroidota bacterium]MBK9799940.1 T9SS type A sorting domain-containing protein [Bacteroidota bacterium]